MIKKLFDISLGAQCLARSTCAAMFFTLCSLLLAPCFSAQAQQPTKVPRIGFLAGGSRAADSLLLEAFWRRMSELGYIEGKTIAAEYRFAEGAPERLPKFAEDLVRLNVDVIVGPGSGVRVAKNVTNTIPIVITYAGDPVGSGLVRSLSHPGGNVTGLSGFASELGGKILELLKKQFPESPVWRFSWVSVEMNSFCER